MARFRERPCARRTEVTAAGERWRPGKWSALHFSPEICPNGHAAEAEANAKQGTGTRGGRDPVQGAGGQPCQCGGHRPARFPDGRVGWLFGNRLADFIAAPEGREDSAAPVMGGQFVFDWKLGRRPTNRARR